MAEELFNKKLNEWITETEIVEKPTYILNPETKKAELVIKKEEVQIPTMYNSLVTINTFCKEGSHTWEMSNSREQIVRCSKCHMKRSLHPIKQKLVDGKIVAR